MAFKRKLCVDEIEAEVENKRARMEEDRLSNLPDDMKLHILSSLDYTKHAVQTSMLLKRWVSLWTWIPVLDFNDCVFHDFKVFDKFVDRVLCLRNPSAKLDQLKFKVFGISSANVLKDVFDYASSHAAKQLEADIYTVDNYEIPTWPVCLNSSFESLASLKLQSMISMSCPYLGPRSGSFKNLTDLYLKRAIITDPNPFSGFPVLEKLTLVKCDISTEGETLSVHARNLSDLTISGYQDFKCCELTTPRLRLCYLPLFRRHNMDLHVLDTMVISCGSYFPHRKRVFDNLFSLFCTFGNVKSLELSWSTVEILSSFHEELVKRSSPFRKLKCLKLDFRYGLGRSFKSTKIAVDVKAYLLRYSPEAEVVYI